MAIDEMLWQPEERVGGAESVDAYPHQRLYVVLNNWPVHFHPDVLEHWSRSSSPFPFFHPPSWPTEPSPRAKQRNLPIQLVTLPTYSLWLNPIEKLWRWLQQDVLHLHPYADDLAALRSLVLDFLARFTRPSRPLLRYTGHLNPDDHSSISINPRTHSVHSRPPYRRRLI